MSDDQNIDGARKLASVRVVEEVLRHTNADALELATILGWQVVTGISDVKPGDKVVYCEIDSLLPGNAGWLPVSIK
mgnify:CR=1 FL=1